MTLRQDIMFEEAQQMIRTIIYGSNSRRMVTRGKHGKKMFQINDFRFRNIKNFRFQRKSLLQFKPFEKLRFQGADCKSAVKGLVADYMNLTGSNPNQRAPLQQMNTIIQLYAANSSRI